MGLNEALRHNLIPHTFCSCTPALRKKSVPSPLLIVKFSRKLFGETQLEENFAFPKQRYITQNIIEHFD